mgnify:FL=1
MLFLFCWYPNLKRIIIGTSSKPTSEVLCDFISYDPCRSAGDIFISVGYIIVAKAISTPRLEIYAARYFVTRITNGGIFEIGGYPLNGGDDIIHEFPLCGVFGMLAFLILFCSYGLNHHKEPYPKKNTRQGQHEITHTHKNIPLFSQNRVK